MIDVCGCNCFYQILPITKHDETDVYPPIRSKFDISDIKSFSLLYNHCVYITNEGEIFGIGVGEPLPSMHPCDIIGEYTKISLKDSENHSYKPISVACSYSKTIILVANQEEGQNNRFLCGNNFYDVGKSNPISLFAGIDGIAAIDTDGAIIYDLNYFHDYENDNFF